MGIVHIPKETMKFTARNDYAFKKLFGTQENKAIAIEFISLVTGLAKNTMAVITFENTELKPCFSTEKAGTLDIKITLNDGQKINVEMQNVWFPSFTKRSLYYWAKLFTADFIKGSAYAQLKKTIIINVLNEPFPLARKMHSIYKILETEEHTILDEVFELHFLDLTRIPKENQETLEKWLLFIKTDDKEVRRMLAEGNEVMEQAVRAMEVFYTEKEQRVMYDAAFKEACDRATFVQEGKTLGLAEGKSLGLQLGAHHAKLETAKLMKQRSYPVADISSLTGLSESEIQNL